MLPHATNIIALCLMISYERDRVCADLAVFVTDLIIPCIDDAMDDGK